MSLADRLRLVWWWLDIRRPTVRDLAYAFLGFDVWGAGVLVAIGVLAVLDLPASTTASHDGITRAASGGAAGAPLSYLAFLLFAAVYEELVFRNLVQKLLYLLVRGWTAILLTSVGFAGLHWWAYTTAGLTLGVALSLFVVFAASVGMGWAYWKTGNVLVPMSIHGAINALAWVGTWV